MSIVSLAERPRGNWVVTVGDEGANRWWLVAAAGLAVFMAQLDTTIVSVALPAIEADLGTSTSATQWVILGYLVPAIALTLPGGRWLDRVPARWALTFSVAGFAAASMLAGVAPGAGWLIAARVVQGGFGALLFALRCRHPRGARR